MKFLSHHNRGRSCCLCVAIVFAYVICWPVGGAMADDQVVEPDSPLVHYYFSKSQHKHEAEWGYRGKQGPQYWGTLSPKYHLAKDGQQQSPIDIQIKDAVAEALPLLAFKYRAEPISMINNGHSIQQSEHPGSFLHVGDQVYSLEQFHVHIPSEHTIDGKHADAEIHFVHKSTSGQVVVVAVMVQADSKDPVHVPLYKILPKQLGEKVVVDHSARNPLDLIPKDHSYIRYLGSFTTPPCSEGVHWIVMETPVSTTPSVLTEFKQIIGGNNRPVQALHGRTVSVTTDASKIQ